MALQTAETKSRKGAVIIALIVVALVAAGIVWYIQANNGHDTTYDTQKFSESFTGLDEQDKQYANIKALHLQPSSETENHYEVLRPLERQSAEQQEANKQTTSDGTLRAVETYALAKNDDAGETQYNASFFVYKLDGAVATQSTGEIIKTQLDTAIAQAKQANAQAPNATVEVSEPAKNADISFKTDKGETIKLASAKFEQTISSTGSGEQKKLTYVVAAAKFGDQLLFVNATFADENEFAAAVEHVQHMADLIVLQLSEVN